MKIGITGATGLIGRNFLFELVKQHASDLSGLDIYVMGRDDALHTLAERIRTILLEEGMRYLGDSVSKDSVISFLEHNTYYVDLELGSKDVFPDASQVAKLREIKFDRFIHIAALPDLRTSKAVEEKVMLYNYEGTKYLLSELEHWNIQELDYVSTAFVAGKKSGQIQPNELSAELGFNNPYEKSKYLAEQEVAAFAEKTGIKVKVFRPGIVCGRLLEQPLGHAHKYDVFYEIFSFIYLEKIKRLSRLEDFFHKDIEVPLRIVFDKTSGANIVPVDYLVKLMHELVFTDQQDSHFHLVHDDIVLFQDFLDATAKAMRFYGVEQVEAVPEDITPSEKLYHQKVGGVLNVYLGSSPKIFDVSNTKSALKAIGLACPKLDEKNIEVLMKQASEQMFAMDKQRVMKRLGVFAVV